MNNLLDRFNRQLDSIGAVWFFCYFATAMAIVAMLCQTGCRVDKTNEYMVVYMVQTNWNTGYQTHQFTIKATHFSTDQIEWVRSYAQQGDTNVTVLILNSVKLDKP